MLLAVWGPHAIGKTVWLLDAMDKLPDIVLHDNLVVVTADNCMEYHYNRSDDVWGVLKNKERWGGVKAQKVPYIDGMVADRNTLWVVEGGRYFNGLRTHIVPAFEKHGGGVEFIISLYDGSVGRQFIIDRCKKVGKKFNPYWTEEKCASESQGKLNACNKWYMPAGIPCMTFTIDSERIMWGNVTSHLLSAARRPSLEWYGIDRPLVVQIKGSNGSGKTAIVRQMISKSNSVVDVEGSDGKVYAVVMEDLGWVAMGRYPDGGKSGGCDTMPTIQSIKDAISDVRRDYPLYDVVFEGMMISTIKSTFYDFLLGMEGISPVFVILNAEVECCLERISNRVAGGRSSLKNRDKVIDKCKRVMRHAKTYDQQYVRYIDVDNVPLDGMLDEFMAAVKQ